MELTTIENNQNYINLKELKTNNFAFQYFEDEHYTGRYVTIQGQKLLHFANCCYLGIENHPKLIEGAIEGVKNYGTQTSMSRAMLSSPQYKQLEELLSQVFAAYPIVFPTTTLGHCSALPILIDKHDAIILDAYVHNSVRMASELCKANGSMVLISKHNDMENVKYLAYRLKKEGYQKIWYCADGIYSMHGNFCNKAGIIDALNTCDNLYAYVDDAHSTGCIGTDGSGFMLDKQFSHPKMFVMHSFAKSFGAVGGCLVAPDKDIAEAIQLTGQTMLFSGPIQPANLGALIESAKLHLSDELPKMQAELLDLIAHYRAKSEEYGLPLVTNDMTPIQLIRVGNLEKNIYILKHLRKHGFMVTAVSPPAVQKNDTGIRISLTRHLTKADIDLLLECLASVY